MVDHILHFIPSDALLPFRWGLRGLAADFQRVMRDSATKDVSDVRFAMRLRFLRNGVKNIPGATHAPNSDPVAKLLVGQRNLAVSGGLDQGIPDLILSIEKPNAHDCGALSEDETSYREWDL